MPVCVVVLPDSTSARALRSELLKTAVPLIRCELVAPSGSTHRSVNPSEDVNIDMVDLLNPDLVRRRRQRSMAFWLMPFGFLAGLVFTQITNLQTFSALGIWAEPILGGVLGMGSGLMGSYAAAASVTSNNEDQIRILRNRSTDGNWLLLLETPISVEIPWQPVQRSKPQQVVRLSEL
ncbi:hypothetical protein OMCYN_00053 [cyanobiont of Ornithocercus magnificus]|nr:hypothetical protein OMCYN_00053 [cyanobiont of Ornithocercus magnificus]